MTNKLYIGNLDYGVTSSELQDFLSAKWKVTECKVIEGKGFSFVTFEDAESATAAKEELNDTEFKGRKLKIDHARENTSRGGDRGGDRRRSFSGGGGDRGGYNKKRY